LFRREEVDEFITMMDAEAFKAGVELRRYTAKDVKQQQYTPKSRSRWNWTGSITWWSIP